LQSKLEKFIQQQLKARVELSLLNLNLEKIQLEEPHRQVTHLKQNVNKVARSNAKPLRH
jgi:hypothetical protein